MRELSKDKAELFRTGDKIMFYCKEDVQEQMLEQFPSMRITFHIVRVTIESEQVYQVKMHTDGKIRKFKERNMRDLFGTGEKSGNGAMSAMAEQQDGRPAFYRRSKKENLKREICEIS